jgi:hypothetical protein
MTTTQNWWHESKLKVPQDSELVIFFKINLYTLPILRSNINLSYKGVFTKDCRGQGEEGVQMFLIYDPPAQKTPRL